MQCIHSAKVPSPFHRSLYHSGYYSPSPLTAINKLCGKEKVPATATSHILPVPKALRFLNILSSIFKAYCNHEVKPQEQFQNIDVKEFSLSLPSFD